MSEIQQFVANYFQESKNSSSKPDEENLNDNDLMIEICSNESVDSRLSTSSRFDYGICGSAPSNRQQRTEKPKQIECKPRKSINSILPPIKSFRSIKQYELHLKYIKQKKTPLENLTPKVSRSNKIKILPEELVKLI